ncbi:MAG: mandelate racemase/muconate lactonizing enzyme family protein [SAR202 cluster bacterium]|nr:mandelate racemase/muconate lactonizing enzyme family protein [SAR202 cluster bacterium]MDP6300121.1 mandelate racemase/muconate lactonizing enzyme family protein [SAR202 cluster bacterium]MDP7104136.1 mandelate racemase/muconate lactonizing enzyme family protein [SAR202 cluster bacterium]MDP7226455.1 mandelate racemase/muconate lactonizing enzyme family protein [SAR202 cluster bacterium]MDP7414881.1 mandelate racemase/muconate lactonizing enzyme family protein [SAR202 cluster bacterium]
MKVTELRTMVVQNEQPYIGGKWWLFLQLMTDEGIVGLGERITGGSYSRNLDDLKTQISLIEEMVDQYVIGESPFQIERIWDRMYASRHDFRHPSLYATPVISAIDMALWDIVGKAANMPIYNLLGGKYHETLRAYAYMPGGAFKENPEEAGEVAARLLEEGNSACKLDPFTPLYPIPRDIPLWEIEHAAKIFESIRNAVGNKLEVGIGTHGQLTTFSAIRVANFLEPYHPYWFEEPVPPENIDEMARVAAHTNIPIATGERLVTKYEFSNLLEKKAAQIIQLDVGQCGGITEAKKIAGIAEAHYAMIAPHMYCGPIAAASAIQIDTCSPNFLIQEANQGPLHKTIFKEPLVLENGSITPPTGPGLGVELDEDVLKAHLIE